MEEGASAVGIITGKEMDTALPMLPMINLDQINSKFPHRQFPHTPSLELPHVHACVHIRSPLSPISHHAPSSRGMARKSRPSRLVNGVRRKGGNRWKIIRVRATYSL